MNFKYKLIILLLVLFPVSGLTSEAADDEQLAEDCRTEGVAMDMSGQSLEDYVVECVAEYHEAVMVNNVELNSSR